MGKIVGALGTLAFLAALAYVGLTGAFRFGAIDFATVFQALQPLTFALLGLGALALLAGLLGLVRSRPGTGGFALIAGAAALASAFGPMTMKSQSEKVPPIHDITTDVKYPPAFVDVRDIRMADENLNSTDYNPDIAAQQQEAYPDLATVRFEQPYEDVFQASIDVLESMGLEIVGKDENAGRIEATATTAWWGFKDDVVVRVNRFREPVEVDVRSSSRVGVSDLGVNAKRIETFLAKLEEQLG
ncbi:MAG: DUF1499 domain-containing protein [Aquisalinus sp.]|nr:DUF1499 domain-containing protein [Aquisalinus sp.]